MTRSVVSGDLELGEDGRYDIMVRSRVDEPQDGLSEKTRFDFGTYELTRPGGVDMIILHSERWERPFEAVYRRDLSRIFLDSQNHLTAVFAELTWQRR